MKARLLLSCLAAALLVTLPLRSRAEDAPAPAGTATAAAPAAAAAPMAPAAKEEEDTPLEKKMQKMGKALKKLKKDVKDPTLKDDALEQIAIVEDGLKASADLVPKKAEDVAAGAERDAFVAAYKKGLTDMNDKVEALKAAVAAGKTDEAAAALDAIFKFEKKEHKEYRRPEPQK